MTKDTELLTEYVRQSLSRQITNQYVSEDGVIKVLTLGGSVEKAIADSIKQTEHGHYLAMDPVESEQIFLSIKNEIERIAWENEVIILCSPAVRMYVKQLIERYMPDVVVLSYNELEPNVEVQSVGVVNVA